MPATISGLLSRRGRRQDRETNLDSVWGDVSITSPTDLAPRFQELKPRETVRVTETSVAECNENISQVSDLENVIRNAQLVNPPQSHPKISRKDSATSTASTLSTSDCAGARTHCNHAKSVLLNSKHFNPAHAPSTPGIRNARPQFDYAIPGDELSKDTIAAYKANAARAGVMTPPMSARTRSSKHTSIASAGSTGTFESHSNDVSRWATASTDDCSTSVQRPQSIPNAVELEAQPLGRVLQSPIEAEPVLNSRITHFYEDIDPYAVLQPELVNPHDERCTEAAKQPSTSVFELDAETQVLCDRAEPQIQAVVAPEIPVANPVMVEKSHLPMVSLLSPMSELFPTHTTGQTTREVTSSSDEHLDEVTKPLPLFQAPNSVPRARIQENRFSFEANSPDDIAGTPPKLADQNVQPTQPEDRLQSTVPDFRNHVQVSENPDLKNFTLTSRQSSSPPPEPQEAPPNPPQAKHEAQRALRPPMNPPQIMGITPMHEQEMVPNAESCGSRIISVSLPSHPKPSASEAARKTRMQSLPLSVTQKMRVQSPALGANGFNVPHGRSPSLPPSDTFRQPALPTAAQSQPLQARHAASDIRKGIRLHLDTGHSTDGVQRKRRNSFEPPASPSLLNDTNRPSVRPVNAQNLAAHRRPQSDDMIPRGYHPTYMLGDENAIAFNASAALHLAHLYKTGDPVVVSKRSRSHIHPESPVTRKRVAFSDSPNTNTEPGLQNKSNQGFYSEIKNDYRMLSRDVLAKRNGPLPAESDTTTTAEIERYRQRSRMNPGSSDDRSPERRPVQRSQRVLGIEKLVPSYEELWS